MTRIWDTFMVNDELDMLELRLTELEDVPNVVHVAVEANVDHQDHPKSYVLTDNLERFAPWKERLVVVKAKHLPLKTMHPDPWAREHAQREWAGAALKDADPDDIVLHGDLDEIPSALVVRNIRPAGMYAFEQRGHFWSLHWQYPTPWRGTVAARLGSIKSFAQMRDARNAALPLPNAGWHLSWLGGADAALKKVGSFCHPEVEKRIRDGLTTDQFLAAGVHVDGVKMVRCDIDATFPKYIREGRHPEAWAQ